jgi:EmrB/QacA subfamily drug resistance transporter
MSEGRRLAILAIVLGSYLMSVIDISIVIAALPEVQAGLRFSDTGLSWVQSAYTLAFGGLLLLGARAGDVLGRRRMFIAGIALFTGASLAVGFAQSPGWMIGARAVQGAGAAVLAPATLAMLTTSFQGEERARAIAWYGATAGIGASLGLVLGGVVTDWISWRVGFLINVPIGLLIALAARRVLPANEPQAGRYDLLGALSSTVAMTALVFGLVRAAEYGWESTVAVASLAIGVLLAVLFVLNERRAQQPVMPLRLFADRERAGAYAARLLYLGAMLPFWFFTTQFLQGVLGFTPLQAGVAFLPTTLANFAAALAVPAMTRLLGNARLLALGIALTVLGMGWLSRLDGDAAYLAGALVPMLLIGAGQGATLSPITTSAVARVRAEDAGAASGLVNVAHQLGGSLGLSLLVAVFAAADASGLAGADLLAHRISAALTAATLLLVLALAVVAALIVRTPTAARAAALTSSHPTTAHRSPR